MSKHQHIGLNDVSNKVATHQALKPNKVTSLPEVAPLPLLPLPLSDLGALYMKKLQNYISKVT